MRFVLKELLGSGGSASVFEATDARDGRPVAVKVLHPHLMGDADARGAFSAEARALQAVRSPNVVELVASDDGSDDDAASLGAPWLAMTLAPGMSLSEVVERDGPLPVAGALAVAAGVLRALVAVHDAGLAHRDVSPGNVLVVVGADGSIVPEGVCLVDFGIAAQAGSASDGAIIGNPGYVSPEQAMGGPVDIRGDLYQVGGMLYFALTGRPPFVAASATRLDPAAAVAEVLRAHRSSPPPVPSVLRAGLPRAVDRLVVRALVKHPDGRFESAQAMLVAVEAAAQATAGSVGSAPDDGSATTVLIAPEANATRVLSTTTAARPTTAGGRSSARRMPGRAVGGWFAALLVAALVASAWFLAAVGPDPAPEPSQTSPSPTAVAEPPKPAPAANFGRIPAIEGSMLGEARAALERAGFAVGALTVQDAALPGDTVLAASPGAGAWIEWGSAVDLVVASGSNRVPAVLGLAEADAVAAVESAGFVAEVRRSSEQSQEGEQGEPGLSPVVTGSLPGAGSVLRLGDEVILMSSSPAVGQPSGSPSAPPSVSPEPSIQPDPSAR